MRVHGHDGSPCWRAAHATAFQQVFDNGTRSVVPTPLAKPPDDEHKSTQLRIKGETYVR